MSATRDTLRPSHDTHMLRPACIALVFLSLGAPRARAQATREQSAVTPAGPLSADSLLNHLVGTWRMVGQVRGHPVSYALAVRRVLSGRYVELHMTDETRPPQYEARVFVGADTVAGHVLVHWLDSFGAAFSVPAGEGYVVGDTLRFEFAYNTGPFRDTFIYRSGEGGWTFRLESGDGQGTWRPFAEYEVRRTERSAPTPPAH